MSQPSKREQIIDVALGLFYKDGFNATGVEKIRETANVSKKTLYNHFKSKDELILTVLRRRDEQFRNGFMRGVEKFGKTPTESLEAIFDAANEWFNDKDFCGCMFINASAEFTDADNPCHIVAAEHMRLMKDYIKGLAEKADAKNPNELAEQLFLLMVGATVKAHVSGDKSAALKAKKMAKVFIEQGIQN
jgi:AcrR family transcriptional regulator